MGGFSLVDQCGLKPLTANPELPYIGYTFVHSSLALPNVFSPTPNPLGVSTTGWEWLKETYPDAVDKVGTIVAPVASVSAQTSRLTAESVGFEYAYSREMAANDTTNNFTADILKMKSEGVRIVDMFSASVPMITAFVQQAAQQGFEYDAVYGAAFDPRFLETIGDPSLADGKVFAPSITLNFLASDRNSDPVLNPVIKWLGETDAETDLGLYAISAWSSGVLFTQSLAAAGEQVDQVALIDALKQVTDFDANGLSPPQQVGAKEGSPCISLMTVKSGSWVQAETDDDAVFDCSGSYHSDRAERAELTL